MPAAIEDLSVGAEQVFGLMSTVTLETWSKPERLRMSANFMCTSDHIARAPSCWCKELSVTRDDVAGLVVPG